METFIRNNYESVINVVKELCNIPAPSHNEEKRAQYCKKWLENIGAKGVYIDEALNVIYPVNCENSNEITVIEAHTDTVFPDTEPMPCIDDGEKIYSPGVGDDTACVSVLMHTAKYMLENKIVPEKGVLFVCNSCEEGLGNLKGTKQIFKDFSGRVKSFVSLDARIDTVYGDCVGSHRYEVEVLTEGGHSYSKFGNKNAISELAKIVNEIYNIDLPEKDGKKVTYNVGEISGGTSVNTIAQSAKMLCEYRSDDKECLEIMKNKFSEIFEKANTDDVKVNVTLVGERPCSSLSYEEHSKYIAKVVSVIEEVIKGKVNVKTASTDGNVPLSLGIPAVAVGSYIGGGSHTREEWIEKESLKKGLEIAIKVVLELI